MVLPLELVEEVIAVIALAEEEPALALGAGLGALFDEAAIGGDAGAGADHDDGAAGVGGKAVVLVWV